MERGQPSESAPFGSRSEAICRGARNRYCRRCKSLTRKRFGLSSVFRRRVIDWLARFGREGGTVRMKTTILRGPKATMPDLVANTGSIELTAGGASEPRSRSALRFATPTPPRCTIFRATPTFCRPRRRCLSNSSNQPTRAHPSSPANQGFDGVWRCPLRRRSLKPGA